MGFLTKVSQFAQRIESAAQRQPGILHEEKSSADLLPVYHGFTPDFFSSDGGRNFEIDRFDPDAVAKAFIAYWVIAARFRQQKIAEAPLMVVKEDQDTGSEAWIPNHELAEILDTPSPDYDMGELLERTSRYLDEGGACLWVKNRDRAGRIARLYPFNVNQFDVFPDSQRIFATFRVQISGRTPVDFDASEVCYFRDFTNADPDHWHIGKSRLDTAMAWLHLSEKARTTIRDLLENAVWPSLVITPHQNFNPQGQDFDRYVDMVNAYARSGKKHKAMAFLGGGSVEQFSAKVRDLVPGELLDRVETVIAGIMGVPAIVLQYSVGIQNSPWSQMEEARRMAYDDCIQPAWRRLERVMTRQLLRPEDLDTTRFIRFDRTKIAALQEDRGKLAATAQAMGRQASLNERRVLMGLEPVKDDPRADEVPELMAPEGAGNSPPGGGAAPSQSELGPNGDNAQNFLKRVELFNRIDRLTKYTNGNGSHAR